jgi:hypothetical protein
MDKARGTKVGSHILSELSQGEADRKISALSTMLRFDPRKDLRSITLFGQDDAPESSAILIDGVFESDALVTMIKGNDGYKGSAHGDHAIHSWVDKGKRTFGTVHGDTIIMSQGKAVLKQTLDVIDGKKTSLDSNSGLSIASGGDVFFSAAADIAALGDKLEAEAAMLQKAKFLNVALAETGRHISIAANVIAANEEISNQLNSMMAGILAFAQLSAEEEPQLAQFANSTKIEKDGNAVGVTMLLPIADIMEMIDENDQWKNEF